MCRLIESICILDGRIRNLEYHQQRMDEARLELLKTTSELSLVDGLSHIGFRKYGKFKLRIAYSNEIEKIELLPYTLREIHSFELIEAPDIDYRFKKEDRSVFETLKMQTLAAEIIITKNGWLTDTSYSNLVFKAGNEWFTPASPLLKGTMRSSLLDKGEIKEIPISKSDLKDFEGFKMINAMISLSESPFYKLDKIRNL